MCFSIGEAFRVILPCTVSPALKIGHVPLVMDILGKVIPVRLLKRSDRHGQDDAHATVTVRDRIPNYSIAAGISRIPRLLISATGATVAMNQQLNHPGPPSISTPQSDFFLFRANNAARQGLNIISPIVGVLPVVGTPLKASVDALLVVLNGVNVSQRVLDNIPIL
jgi:hypothetical protein